MEGCEGRNVFVGFKSLTYSRDRIFLAAGLQGGSFDDITVCYIVASWVN